MSNGEAALFPFLSFPPRRLPTIANYNSFHLSAHHLFDHLPACVRIPEHAQNRRLEQNMVQATKFRGVRQRQWGSWVAEIRHPLLKKRIWLGTFETAEAAARAYDQAAVLMSGQNAKTNFPVNNDGGGNEASPMSAGALSEILGAKLKKCCKNPAPSITCLRLDNDNSNIGVWQKRAGRHSGSHWVMKVELKNKNILTPPFSRDTVSMSSDEENKIAMQMVEELLDWNGSEVSFSTQLHEGKGSAGH